MDWISDNAATDFAIVVYQPVQIDVDRSASYCPARIGYFSSRSQSSDYRSNQPDSLWLQQQHDSQDPASSRKALTGWKTYELSCALFSPRCGRRAHKLQRYPAHKQGSAELAALSGIGYD
ncbi:hypothetical protein EYF80_032481 [Liparis tanakae]|uniref:Uncharacterized protein n=1 Tax=Liparis tanakae TaxID=230148 RepID=A0A4Z2GXB4_9TELE|nr:hypothetical protein EYF80_032481 [Liparis tanakae]